MSDLAGTDKTGAAQLMDWFRKYPPDQQQDFVRMLSLYLDIHLMDEDQGYMIVSKTEYRRMMRAQQVNDAERRISPYDLAGVNKAAKRRKKR